MRYKLLAGHEAIQAGSTNGSNFGNASLVRVFNADTTFHVISVETSAAALVGSIHLGAGQSMDIEKNVTDEIFVDSGAAVFGTPVAQKA